jgi:hypothetical protein
MNSNPNASSKPADYQTTVETGPARPVGPQPSESIRPTLPQTIEPKPLPIVTRPAAGAIQTRLDGR